MDLKAAHARSLADLDDALRAEDAAEKVLTEARAHTSEMRAMAQALERALNLYEKPVSVVVEGVPEAEIARAAAEASVMPISAESELCLLYDDEEPTIVNFSFNMLSQLGGQASTQDVCTAIAQAGGKKYNEGEDYDVGQVRSALQWQLKTGRVVRVAPATWRIARKSDEP